MEQIIIEQGLLNDIKGDEINLDLNIIYEFTTYIISNFRYGYFPPTGNLAEFIHMAYFYSVILNDSFLNEKKKYIIENLTLQNYNDANQFLRDLFPHKDIKDLFTARIRQIWLLDATDSDDDEDTSTPIPELA